MSVSAAQIGAFLREARRRQGAFSAEQAAVAVGTTGRTMGTWERGEVAPPADTFFALVALYGADVRDVLAVAPAGAPAVKRENPPPGSLPTVPLRQIAKGIPIGQKSARAANDKKRRP
jgi:DNA-binding XRE family transcriptional regulator